MALQWPNGGVAPHKLQGINRTTTALLLPDAYSFRNLHCPPLHTALPHCAALPSPNNAVHCEPPVYCAFCPYFALSIPKWLCIALPGLRSFLVSVHRLLHRHFGPTGGFHVGISISVGNGCLKGSRRGDCEPVCRVESDAVHHRGTSRRFTLKIDAEACVTR